MSQKKLRNREKILVVVRGAILEGICSFPQGKLMVFCWLNRGVLCGRRGGFSPRLPGAEKAPRFSSLFFQTIRCARSGHFVTCIPLRLALPLVAM
jgi:hypothetical protein